MDERDDLSSGTPGNCEAEVSLNQPLAYYQQLITQWSHHSESTCDGELDQFAEAKKLNNLVILGVEGKKTIESDFSLRPSRLKVGKQTLLTPIGTKISYGYEEEQDGQGPLVGRAETEKTIKNPSGNFKTSLRSSLSIMDKLNGDREERDTAHGQREWKGGWHNENKLFEMEKKHREWLDRIPVPQAEDATAKNEDANSIALQGSASVEEKDVVLQGSTSVEEKDEAAKPYSAWVQGHMKAKEAEKGLGHRDRMGLGRVKLFRRSQKKQNKWSGRGRGDRTELDLSILKPSESATSGDQESSVGASTAAQSRNSSQSSTTLVRSVEGSVEGQYEILKSHREVVKAKVEDNAKVEGKGSAASSSIPALSEQKNAGMERRGYRGSGHTLKSLALQLGTMRQQQQQRQEMKENQQQDETANSVTKVSDGRLAEFKSKKQAKTVSDKVGSTLKAKDLKGQGVRKGSENLLLDYHALKRYHSLKLHSKKDLNDPDFHLRHVLDGQHDESSAEESSSSTSTQGNGRKVDLETLLRKLQRVQSGEDVDLESLIDKLQLLKSGEAGQVLATMDARTESIVRGPEAAAAPMTATNMNQRVRFNDGAASEDVANEMNMSSYIDDVLNGMKKKLERADGPSEGYENFSCGTATGCTENDNTTISTAGMEEEIMDYDSVEGRWVSMGWRKKKAEPTQQYSFFCCGSLLPFFSAKVSVVDN